jgi:hypothetical protein
MNLEKQNICDCFNSSDNTVAVPDVATCGGGGGGAMGARSFRSPEYAHTLMSQTEQKHIWFTQQKNKRRSQSPSTASLALASEAAIEKLKIKLKIICVHSQSIYFIVLTNSTCIQKFSYQTYDQAFQEAVDWKKMSFHFLLMMIISLLWLPFFQIQTAIESFVDRNATFRAEFSYEFYLEVKWPFENDLSDWSKFRIVNQNKIQISTPPISTPKKVRRVCSPLIID